MTIAIHRGIRWFLGFILFTQLTACSNHYQNGFAVGHGSRSGMISAGIVDRRVEGDGSPIRSASSLLSRKSALSDVSGELDRGDLDLLLADPARFHFAEEERAELRARLERDYVLIGQLATAPVDEERRWAVLIVIPLGYSFITFAFPVSYGRDDAVPHASLELRVVDLRAGEVLGEFVEVYRKQSRGGSVEEKKLEHALSVMKIGAGR